MSCVIFIKWQIFSNIFVWMNFRLWLELIRERSSDQKLSSFEDKDTYINFIFFVFEIGWCVSLGPNRMISEIMFCSYQNRYFEAHQWKHCGIHSSTFRKLILLCSQQWAMNFRYDISVYQHKRTESESLIHSVITRWKKNTCTRCYHRKFINMLKFKLEKNDFPYHSALHLCIKDRS